MADKPVDAPETIRLRREAAALGPGYLGHREKASPEARQELAARLTIAVAEIPAYLTHAADWTQRRAKLFEVGHYPDKGVTITPNDLTRWCQAFDLPVPVLVEHGKSPLELGYLTAVEAQDGQLFGMVSLIPEANALIERSGARFLSLGFTPEMEAIREVSIVTNPRVATARLFSTSTVSVPGCEWRDVLRDRLQELETKERDRQIQAYIERGQLLPAQVGFARALMGLDQTVCFDDAQIPAAHLVAKLIEAGAPHLLFRETAPSTQKQSAQMEPDQEQFFRRHFAGLNLEEIAKRLPTS